MILSPARFGTTNCPPAEYVSEREMQIVWRNLMSYLCSRHRTTRRNGRPTDYNIEELRRDHYEGGFPDAYYFRRLISWVAKQHREIEVDRDVIRLTRFGFDNCEKYDPTFQRDIEY